MTRATRPKILAYLGTGPKTIEQVADHFLMRYGSTVAMLGRACDRGMIRVRREGGRNVYEAKP